MLTTDQWQQRVQDARRRLGGVRREAPTQKTDPLQSEKEEAEAADRPTGLRRPEPSKR